MKPAAFAWHRPRSVDEALELLAQHADDEKPLAGGQSLVPAMNFRLAQPARLVDLNEIAALSYMRPTSDGGVAIGAMTRQREVEHSALVAERSALVTETLPFVAHHQIRNRGTFGGSLAHADPAAELPAVAVALGARFKLVAQGRERWIDASDFYQGLFTTALEPGELLAEVVLPPPAPRMGWAFEEVARRHGDFALVGVAVMVRASSAGDVDLARIVLLSVGEGPVIAVKAAAALVGTRAGESTIHEAARVCAAHDVDPPSDLHASAKYRRRLTEVLTRRALARAVLRANEGGARATQP